MLSAFKPRPLVELKQRDKSRIESILAYGDRLHVGLNNGNLRIYRINEIPNDEEEKDNGHALENGSSPKGDSDGGSTAPPTTPKVKPTDLLREQEKFSKYKIEQLAVIKETRLLVSLSGGYVSIYDLQTYQLQEQLSRTKGASLFAVTSNIINDSETGVPSIVSRLAVAVKRKILLWAWQDMELSVDTQEITLVSGIKTLAWVSGKKFVAGLSSNHVLVDIETMEITDLVGPGSIGGAPGQETGRLGGVASMSYIGMGSLGPKPLATRLSEGRILLAKDISTHFIDINGNSLGRRQIPWSSAPEAIGYSYPYLLALQDTSKGTLEIRNPETFSLLQSISLPSATSMHIPQPNTSLAHAGKGFLVASDRVIWRMEALSYDSQVDALIEKEHLDEAISLIDMLEDALLKDKSSRLREVKLQKAEQLFNEQKYRDSLDLFADISAPPEIVIRLYPRIIAGGLSSIIEDRDESDSSGDELRKQSNGVQVQVEGASTEEVAVSRNSAYAPSLASFLRGKTDESSDSSSIRGRLAETDPRQNRLEGKNLKAAVRELQGFLADVRRRFQRFLNPNGSLKASTGGDTDEFVESVRLLVGLSKDYEEDEFEVKLRETAKLVDTTLFRAHMYATPSLAGSLFRIANFCDPDVVMEKLEETGRHNELIDFYFGKKMHRRALVLLQKFGQAETEDENAPQLHGPKRMIAYLQSLPPEMIDLILEFSEWPVRADPNLGMEIFLADSENAETLPRQQVVDFLQNIDPQLAVRYLEHVVGELNDMTPDLHQRLLSLYLERLLKHKGGQSDFKDADAYEAWKDNFMTMLKSSCQYSPAKMLDRLPRKDPDLVEARAIAFSKMGQHKQALEIYVFKLEDPKKAEEYCNHIHLTEETSVTSNAAPQHVVPIDANDTKHTIYLTLLSLYLCPPNDHEPQYGPALDLLANHGSRLPPNATLNLIPEKFPVQQLEFYFQSRIRAANSIMSEARIVAGLRNVQNIKMQAQLLVGEGTTGGNKGRNRHVTITEERVCGICHKRLGGSVISVFPDNSVVHLGCANRMNTAS